MYTMHLYKPVVCNLSDPKSSNFEYPFIQHLDKMARVSIPCIIENLAIPMFLSILENYIFWTITLPGFLPLNSVAPSADCFPFSVHWTPISPTFSIPRMDH